MYQSLMQFPVVLIAVCMIPNGIVNTKALTRLKGLFNFTDKPIMMSNLIYRAVITLFLCLICIFTEQNCLLIASEVPQEKCSRLRQEMKILFQKACSNRHEDPVKILRKTKGDDVYIKGTELYEFESDILDFFSIETAAGKSKKLKQLRKKWGSDLIDNALVYYADSIYDYTSQETGNLLKIEPRFEKYVARYDRGNPIEAETEYSIPFGTAVRVNIAGKRKAGTVSRISPTTGTVYVKITDRKSKTSEVEVKTESVSVIKTQKYPSSKEFRKKFLHKVVSLSGYRYYIVSDYDSNSGSVVLTSHRIKYMDREEAQRIGITGEMRGQRVRLLNDGLFTIGFSQRSYNRVIPLHQIQKRIVPWSFFRDSFELSTRKLDNNAANDARSIRHVSFPKKIDIEYKGETATEERMPFAGTKKEEIYYVSCTIHEFEIKSGDKRHTVKVAIPVSLPEQSEAIKQAKIIVQTLPLGFEGAVSYINLNPVKRADDIRGQICTRSMEIKGRYEDVYIMDIFIESLDQHPLRETLEVSWHETGHLIMIQLFGNNPENFIEWVRAMNLDIRFISDYAKTNIDEDFAETVSVYIRTDAGRLNPEKRLIVPNRFEVLDRLFGVDTERAKIESVLILDAYQ